MAPTARLDCSSCVSTAASLPSEAAEGGIDDEGIVSALLEQRRNPRHLQRRRLGAKRGSQLRLHLPIGIVEPRRERRLDGTLLVGHPSFGDADGGRADVPRRVAECLDDGGRLNRVDAVERPQRVEAGARIRRVVGELLQRRDRRRVPALDQQLLRRVAPPAVRMRQASRPAGADARRTARAGSSRRVVSCTIRKMRPLWTGASSLRATI